MSKQHTPGPMTQGTTNEGKACVWLGGATEPEHEMGPDATWIDCNTEANARRVAACWNACEGFSIEELEGADLFKDSIESQDLIDGLLAALEFYMSAFGQHLEFVGQKFDDQQVEADKKARAAIAKATNQ